MTILTLDFIRVTPLTNLGVIKVYFRVEVSVWHYR